MPLSTLGVVSAVTPSVIETYFSHFLHRGPLRQKPTAHISYHEGLRLIRQFLHYSSLHTVEDLQVFTAQWVPAPLWARTHDVDIAAGFQERSAKLLLHQLGSTGVEAVGGREWWQWRRPDAGFKGEWIEMRKDYSERKRTGAPSERVLLYVHGGAYYFGSVDEHRYQMQRHARKLKARVFAPRYRLAPQFPFPCGLQDCIAAYLYLLQDFKPSQILFAGDSAGGGMVLSMLVTLRDQGVPLPAGTILLSPWVDLTHSFPSVAGDGSDDYIPAHGFHHKPSMAWPPPTPDDVRLMNETPTKKKKSKSNPDGLVGVESAKVDDDHGLSIKLDGKTISIKEQIQMYSTNALLTHPLVSPVQQASLGGLPPMLVQVGGAELLRDEQIYLAHKAANPKEYPPSGGVMERFGLTKEDVSRYPPTNVQLQVWDDLCHVPHTLSFTRPAKYMYRAVAQFGAWALAGAQHVPVEVMDGDQASIISDGEGSDTETGTLSRQASTISKAPAPVRSKPPSGIPTGSVGKAGDPLPPFKDSMIRQRVTRHGETFEMLSTFELACLHLDPASIGTIKPGPVKKWLAQKALMDSKFASERKKIAKKRVTELQKSGEPGWKGEFPPPTALAGHRNRAAEGEKASKGKKSWGLALWSGWGSSHDESTLEREEAMEHKQPDLAPPPTVQPDKTRQTSTASEVAPPRAGAIEMPVERTESLSPQTARRLKRRTSSMSMLSAVVGGRGETQRDKDRAGREDANSLHRGIGDSGQAESENGSPVRLERTPADLLTQAGRPSTSTAISSSATSLVENERATPEYAHPLSEVSNISALDAPTTGSIHPDSTKVEGSENTYMSPDGSRPHNGTMAYPFKIRNPMPEVNGSTVTLGAMSPDNASLASSTRDVDGNSTRSPVQPREGSSRTADSPRPAQVTPVQRVQSQMYSDKEFVTPSYEKEVVFHPGPTSAPSAPLDDPRLRRLDTNLSTHSAVTNGQQRSNPHSPADSTYSNNPFARNAAVNAAAGIFTGGGGYEGHASPGKMNYAGLQMQTPPMMAPKPVGFTYNPRDLRNAMLMRQQALEQQQSQQQPQPQQHAQQSQPQQYQQQQQQQQQQQHGRNSPTSSHATHQSSSAPIQQTDSQAPQHSLRHQSSQQSFAVELPAARVPGPASNPPSQSQQSIQQRTPNHPIELSALSNRQSLTPRSGSVSIPSQTSSSAPRLPELPSSRFSLGTATRMGMGMLGAGGKQDVRPGGKQDLRPGGKQNPRPLVKQDGSANVKQNGSLNVKQNASVDVTENVVMPVVEGRGGVTQARTPPPPTPPPKDEPVGNV